MRRLVITVYDDWRAEIDPDPDADYVDVFDFETVDELLDVLRKEITAFLYSGGGA